MINIRVHGFPFHSLVLFTQGTFSSWYKVLIQVGEINIWQPHLAKIKYTEIHFTYRCSVFKLNNNTLFGPICSCWAWQWDKPQRGKRYRSKPSRSTNMLEQQGCVLLLKIPSLYLLSVLPPVPAICIQSRLIPPSPSHYICIRAGANLET